jgi:WhiB family redox-sensing transcriptional regulator
MRRAACKGVDPELFFAASTDDDEGDEPMSLEQIRAARAVCRHCPVAMACFEWAMENRKLTGFGIWGMTVPSQRDEYRCRRNEQRKSA